MLSDDDRILEGKITGLIFRQHELYESQMFPNRTATEETSKGPVMPLIINKIIINKIK